MEEINIYGSSQVTTALAAGVPAQTAAKLVAWGVYLVWCDEGDIYIKLDPTNASTGLTANNGFPIFQGSAVPISIVSDADLYLGAVCAVAGTFRYHRIS